MHELAVTQNILETCLKHAFAANANKIVNIKIVIGQFASILDDSVEFYWAIITNETIAQESKLEFIRIPASFNCRDCRVIFNWKENLYNCPSCNSTQISLQSGTEFYIDSIEIN